MSNSVDNRNDVSDGRVSIRVMFANNLVATMECLINVLINICQEYVEELLIINRAIYKTS